MRYSVFIGLLTKKTQIAVISLLGLDIALDRAASFS